MEIFTQITAAGDEEANFLQTRATPGEAPNWEFFCPCLCTCVYLPGGVHPENGPIGHNTEHSTLAFTVIADLIIECRGTKVAPH